MSPRQSGSRSSTSQANRAVVTQIKALRLAQTIERLSQGSRGLGFADAYLVDRYWVSSSYITT